MNYLVIGRINGGYTIRARMETNPEKYHRHRYIGYSLREAEQKYRQEFGLKGKHLTKIHI